MQKGRMSGGALWCILLLAVPLVSTSCSDLGLRRSTAGGEADTTPPVPEPSKASRVRRTPKDAVEGSAFTEHEKFARVRRALRRLVTVEEAFFAENGTYSDDLQVVGLTLDPNISIQFLWLSRDGWAASGTHSALPGDCVVFVGQAQAAPTTLKYVRQSGEGTPVCDESRQPEPAASSPTSESMHPESSDTGSALDNLAPTIAMKVDLRNLVRSQDTYFATQGIYSRRTEPLAIQYLWHKGVRIKILAADDRSWTAKATHPRFPGKSCVIWYGAVAQRPFTDDQRHQGDRPGVPVCDQ